MVSDRNVKREPTIRDRLSALDNIRLWAEAVDEGLKETPGGDAFTYEGGMNPVENLREAIDDYHTLIF